MNKLLLRNTLFFLSVVAVTAQAKQWKFPEQKVIPTVFMQGMMDSHKQCAKYCGPDGFQALTGELVQCPNSIELIHTPFIGKELDEIKLSNDSGYSWYHPLNGVDKIQRYAFARQLANYGYQVKNSKINGPTIKTHSVDFFKLNFAQERDIDEYTQKIDLADQVYPYFDKVIMGPSRGAATAFDAYARHHYDGVRMVVLEGCFDTVDHTMALRMPLMHKIGLTKLFQRFLESVSEYRRDGINPLKSVDSFPENVPVVFITSKADLNVPASCTKEVIKRLKVRAKNPVHVLVLDNAGHNYYALGNGDDQKRYLQFMHTLYKKYNLPYIPEYVKQKQD